MALSSPGLFVVFVVLATLVSVHGEYYFPGSSGSYATFNKWHACIDSSISFEFRTKKSTGLLMYSDDGGTYDFFEVRLYHGTVVLRLNIVDGRDGNVHLEMGSELDDNKWHKVGIVRNRMETTLTVDGESDGKVSFGSDFNFGEINNNSLLYFGGLPSTFRGYGLHKLALPSSFYEERFAGYVRNMMVTNCTCEVQRVGIMLGGEDVVNDPQESCEVADPCRKGCVCVSLDRGSTCDCSRESCRRTPTVHYHLPFDLVRGSVLINPSGLDAEVRGPVKLVDGVAGNAIELDGKNNFVRLVGQGHRYECFGDLQLCDNGFTMGLWINITNPGFNQTVYLSNGGHTSRSHGVAMMFNNGHLEMRARQKDGKEWRTKTDNVLPRHWYHVATTWSKENGLKLFINGEQVDHDPNPTIRNPRDVMNENNEYILGRANDGSVLNRTGTIVMDEFHFWSEEKTIKQIRNAGPFYKFFFDMNWITSSGVLMQSDAMTAVARGGAKLVQARIGSGLATDGRQQYVEGGAFNDECLGDIGQCWYGLTLGMWLNVPRIQDGAYLLYTGPNGLSLYMDNGALVGRYVWNNRQWLVTYPDFKAGKWYFVELTWSKLAGAKMFVDLKEVSSQLFFTPLTNGPRNDNFYLARSPGPDQPIKYADAIMDDLELWYGQRHDLVRTKFILRGEPFYYFFDFNSMFGNHVINSRDDINVSVIGRGAPVPYTVRGKIFDALQLQGENQFLDFNQHGDSCFSNANDCYFGFLLSLWIKADTIHDTTYFLSNGMNGATVSYSAGKLHVTMMTWTRIWQLSTDRFLSGRWHYLEVDWDPYFGLSLWLDLKRMNATNRYRTRNLPDGFPYSADYDNFYIGRGNLDMTGEHFGNIAVDYMHYYYASRRYLLAFDWILRAKPPLFQFGFDSMKDDRVEHSSVNIKANGYPKLVTGKLHQAILLDGRNQYLNFGNWRDACFGNLQLCNHGFTWSMYLNFIDFANYMFYYSTGLNSGMTLFYRDGYLNAMFTLPGYVWRVNYPVRYDQNGFQGLQRKTWYFVEFSWDREHGLYMYLNDKLVAESAVMEAVGGADKNNYTVYVGRANDGDTYDGKFAYANAVIDELEVWYGRREEMIAHGFMIRGAISYIKIPFEDWLPGRLEHSFLDIRLHNDPTRFPGKVGDAAFLRGNNQYIDLGDNRKNCFGNLELCAHGQTVIFWVNPKNMQDESYVVSSQDYDIYTKDGRLYARYVIGDRKWEVSTDEVRPNQWQRVDVTWHPEQGLSMFVNNAKVDEVSSSSPIVPFNKSDPRVYVGRTSNMTNKSYFNGIIDELDVWFAPRSHLVANDYFKYENIARELYVFERIENNRVDNTYGRDVIVYGDPQIGPGRDNTAIIFDGRNEYLDFGENITCAGNLYFCYDGLTVRLLMKANTIKDKQYILSSENIDLYFDNGKLVGQMQNGDEVWDTQTDVIEPGKWYMVELSWYPADGLSLHVNCLRKDKDVRSSPRPIGSNRYNRRFYAGRANSDMIQERYGDVEIEKLEIWNARRDYMEAYRLLQADCFPSSTLAPPIIDDFKPYIHCTGNTVLGFDNSRQSYRRNTNEELTLQFKASFSDGLLWYTENPSGKMFISLKGGRLIVEFNYGTYSGPVRHIIKSSAQQMVDGQWHKVELKKRNRDVTLMVDGRFSENQRLDGDFYLANDRQTYLCGTPNTGVLTNYEIERNYIGDFKEATLTGDPSEPVIDYIDLVLKRPLDPFVNVSPDLIIRYPDSQTTRRPPVTDLPPIDLPPTATFHTDDSHIMIERWDAVRTGTLELRFKTSHPEGLILYNGPGFGNKDFVALELFGGDLFLVANLGGTTHRSKLNALGAMNDGAYHTVKIERDHKKFISTLDDRVTEMVIPGRDETLELATFLFVGGVTDFRNVPWDLWTRRGFKGCIRDLKVNTVRADLKQFADHQRVTGVSFDAMCGQPALNCNSRPCYNGICINHWAGHRCDCSGTPYTGDRCNEPATVINFNGDQLVRVNITSDQVNTHTNDISINFRTPLPNGLIFTTKSQDNEDYIRLCIENGMPNITIKDRGTIKTMKIGRSVNDNKWHTVYIKRRGQMIEFWLDGSAEHEIGEIQKRDFFIDVNNIYVGRPPDNEPRTSVQTCDRNFIGEIQNGNFDGIPIFDFVNKGDTGHGFIVTSTNTTTDVKPFGIVTFTSADTYVELPSQQPSDTFDMSFMFKTSQQNGLLMFAGERGQFIAMELVDGYLHYVFDNGYGPETTRINSVRLNDNNWHSVDLKLPTRTQHVITVDGSVTSLTRQSAHGRLTLRGSFYVGGVPAVMYSVLPPLVNSVNGFKGCFASWFVNRYSPDLLDTSMRNGGYMQLGCREEVSFCNPNPCSRPGAVCVSTISGFYCDCNMTAHVTIKAPEYCGFEAEGFRFGKEGDAGLVTYIYPASQLRSSTSDRLALGFMTWVKDGVLFRAEGKNVSGVAGNYIEVRLEDGYVVTEYRYNGGHGSIYDRNQMYNDGLYHVVRFERDNDKTRMYVDNYAPGAGLFVSGGGQQGSVVTFVDQAYLYAGGRRDASGNVFGAFDGIVAGVYWNGIRLLDWAIANKAYVGDIFVAPHLFNIPRSGGVGAVVGGGKGGAGGVLYAAAGVPAAATAAAATTAGIILGILAALLLLATALMWAFYKCKPGWIPCAGYSPVKTVVAGPLGAGAVAESVSLVKFANGTKANGMFIAGGGGATVVQSSFSSSAAAGGAGARLIAGGGGGGTATVAESSFESYDGFAAGGGRAAAAAGGASTTTTVTSTERHTFVGGGGGGYAGGGAAAGGHRTVATNTLDRSGAGYAAGGGGGGMSESFSSYNESFSAGGGAAGGGGATLLVRGGGGTTTTTTEVVETTLIGGGYGGGGYGGGYGGGGGAAAAGYGAGAASYSGHNMYSVAGSAATIGSGATLGTLSRIQHMSSPPPPASQFVSIAPEVRVESFIITANGHYVITGSSMGPPQVWDVRTGDLIRSMSGERLGSTDVHLACNESLLAGLITVEKVVNMNTIDRRRKLDMRLQLWGFESGSPLEMPAAVHGTASCLMHDRDRLIVGRAERDGRGISVLVWDLGGNQLVRDYGYGAPAGFADTVTFVAVTNDDRYCVAGFKNHFSHEANYVIFDLTGSLASVEPLVYAIAADTECTALLDHHEAVTGTHSGELLIWSLRSGKVLRSLTAGAGHSMKAPHADRVKALTLSKDLLVVASADQTLTVWDLHNETLKHRLNGHDDEVWCCTVSLTQDLIISGSRDNTIRLWRNKDGSEISSFNALMDIFSVKISNDKRVIVALGDKDHSRKLIMLQVLHARHPKGYRRAMSGQDPMV